MIDASALAKYILHEDGWDQVSKYLRERRSLYSIDHILKECGNVIWKHCYVRKLVGVDTAPNLFQKLMKVVDVQVIIVEPENTYLERALEISLNSGLPVYDALYIAQAERYGEILTSDESQVGIARALGVKVRYIE